VWHNVCKKGSQIVRIGTVVTGQRSETIHRANLSAIIRVLHEHGPRSRSELVAATGLTRSAIRALVRELAAAGLVTEDHAVRLGTPGRPSPLVRPEPTGAVVLAFEVLVDSIAAAVVGLGGKTLDRIRVDRPLDHLQVDDVVAELVRLAAALRVPDAGPTVGVGVAVAGVVRRSDGLVFMAPNLGWVDVPFGERLERALGLDLPFTIMNDADAGMLAEHRRGAAVGVDDALYISGEVGVGGGAIVGGQPLLGSAGLAGEIGHMTVNPDGVACRCGARGCWETEVGRDVILRRAGVTDHPGLAGVEQVIAAATDGSPEARAALVDVGRWLGIGLGALVNILNPRMIVLGGVHARMYPVIRDVVDAEVGRRSLAAPRAEVRIVPAMLGVDAPLIGASEAAFEPLLADPAAWMTSVADADQMRSA
jgi:predicted NBD/HSP70 family sugar kinase